MVAVIDSGVHPHPDLRRNLLNGTDEAVDSGGAGKTDDDGHGTRMAALIAAHGRSSDTGIEGIAPAAKILPIRVSKDGNGNDSTLIGKGIDSAIARQARVINISLSAGPAFELQKAVDSALDRDIVVVAGAGNTSSGAIIGYPAAMDGVLAVGATGRNGRHAPISIKNPKVQICAPGVDITSAQPKEKYSTATGTSDSTAIVSGAVALVRAEFPRLSAAEVVHRLTATADDIGPPGRDDECGFGRLNIVKALTAEVPPLGGAATTAPVPATSTAAPSPAPSADVAAPDGSSGGSALVWGGLVGLVVAGGLGAILFLRRRRT